MKLAVLVLMFAALTGCVSTTNRTMGAIVDSWRGAPAAEAIDQLGTPLHQYRSEDGNQRIYEWTTSTRLVPWKLGVDRQQADQPGAALVRGSCTLKLAASEAGEVVDGIWQGSDCCAMAVSGYCASLKRQGKALVSTPKL